MKKSYLYIIGTLVLTGILILYNQLGGFNEPDISIKSISKYQIAGKMYEGKISDRQWEELFHEVRSIKEKLETLSPMAIIWYNSPEEEKGAVKAFVGFMSDDSMSIPDGYEIKLIEMQGLIRAEIKGHAVVMPSPKKIVEKIHLYAKTRDIILRNEVIDWYPEESIIYTEIPIESGFFNEDK